LAGFGGVREERWPGGLLFGGENSSRGVRLQDRWGAAGWVEMDFRVRVFYVFL